MSSSTPARNGLAALTIGALGVVYGDIGTSPLYALRECFSGPHAIAATPDNVLGVISLIFWSLIIVVTLKYVVLVLRADNRGEGGILALMALVAENRQHGQRGRWLVIGLGLFGAALFYGDGMITPAISVLSAVEGLKTATPLFDPYVVPITLLILIGLFVVQSHGTARVGISFGPVMCLWFVVLGVLGIVQAVQTPQVFAALWPVHAVRFFAENGWHGFIVLGAVFLCLTGGEALYADMGHFGARPIRLAWFGLVLPGIVLNYFGQGALLLAMPAAADNPFYLLAPGWALYPLVALSTLATVIASQAVISGVYSLTRQAVQLGYCPRVTVIHTSADEMGQIYIPSVNWGLLVAVLGLVVGFGSSSALAAAYGIAVTITMVITALLLLLLAHRVWNWPRAVCVLLIVPFLLIDLAFFGANALKIGQGGWFPLVAGAGVYILMTTWQRGRELLATRMHEGSLPLTAFLADVEDGSVLRVPGTAVFLTSDPDGVPHTLLHNLKHNKVLHERVVLLTVLVEEVPRVDEADRVRVDVIGNSFFRVAVRYGFMEEPDVPLALGLCRPYGLDLEPMDTTYFLGRETLISTTRPGMARWRERLFVNLSRNAARAMDFFRIPPNRVVELGTQIEL
ncbi:KUP system potassium uptake protein [Plasticicumulans lactativorans]|uniref:Probable potassium transport system protein Kup n=1 Tax=Plasticicumulans lactativorans TaxID=1133106 RepID=A0A4R2L9U8_9GAMM|nr:potassium transporter Kup [Plasticicumulans lactativorans]TCO81049.1 KUP system potassium uptake protein [Plasticicumulans lactativorans]